MADDANKPPRRYPWLLPLVIVVAVVVVVAAIVYTFATGQKFF
ncbi:hypothetical protein GCM10025867_24410 [Frondihabitans sucicola]|uniref:Uncharacterized protein n=1 Tax=Frondihabitans sucicola TaxID=1268041 RepID=A0ABM8GPM8_9MICO|nr:hypothetical protein [Frondihabitans sucicola]BDZ50200.1 hypothetical protein GCM10025867_24410 [Frondihabitans sucicola]